MQHDLLTLHIGNDYELLSEEAATPDRSGQFLKRHKFRLFCRVARGGEELIRSVSFELHESFQPNVYVKTAAPFETVQTAWGFFTARIHVDFYRSPTQVFE